MDDIAHGIQNPAIIDIKIGRVTYDPEANIEKRNHHIQRYPPVVFLGYQLLGMRVRFK
jgi:inositol-polyphosphate multikinase